MPRHRRKGRVLRAAAREGGALRATSVHTIVMFGFPGTERSAKLDRVKLCLVDGTYELFRAYFAAPRRSSTKGQEVGALLYLGRSLAALGRSGEFTHFAVAFDTVIESFRNQLFPGYKTGEGIPEDLSSQFAPAERLTAALGFAVLSMIEFEADDGLATLARRFEDDPRFEQIVIASPDKDLTQCVVGERVVTWDRMRKVRYDEAGVVTKFGVRPKSIPDYLALVGDTADGIPGVPKFGARASSTLLARFERVDEIPRHVEDWGVALRGSASLLESLRAHESEVLLYRTLATLRTDVPLSHSEADLAFSGPRAEELARLAEELGEPSLARFEPEDRQ